MRPIAITIGTDQDFILARADKEAERNKRIQLLDFVKIGNVLGRIVRIEEGHDFPSDNEISRRAKAYLKTGSGPDPKTQEMLYKRLFIDPLGQVLPTDELAEYQGGIGYFERVTKAEDPDIAKLYPCKNGLKIGCLTSGYKKTSVPFRLPLDSALVRHLSIFGKNGSGKTNLLKELIASNLDQESPLPLLVFGHPDIGLDNPNDRGTKGILSLGNDRVAAYGYNHQIKLSPQELTLSDIFDQFQEMSTAMRDLWYHVHAKKPDRFIEILARYDLNADPLNLKRKVTKTKMGNSTHTQGVATIPTIDAVCKQARILANYVDSQAQPIVSKILADLKRGKTVLVNTFNMSDYYQGLFVRLLLTRLQRAGKYALHKKVPQRFLVIIDEAQSFIKRAGESIAEFVRECRKFGVTLIFSTQSPKAIPESVYGQIYSTISFHLNKADIKVLVDNAPGLDDCKAIIQKPPLRQSLGVAIVQALGYPYPAVVKIPRFERRIP